MLQETQHILFLISYLYLFFSSPKPFCLSSYAQLPQLLLAMQQVLAFAFSSFSHNLLAAYSHRLTPLFIDWEMGGLRRGCVWSLRGGSAVFP